MKEYLTFRFPEDFLIGTANSAFQSEGAWDRDGKTESNMDYYARLKAGQSRGKTSFYTKDLPDRGCFFYDHYEEYIEDMQKTGQNTYRLSISWCRVIPDGVGQVNPKGIAFYNKVIDKLLSCNIIPLVDLYHWDMPQCLQEQGGFANPEFPNWFENYAKVCFEAFGDRVKLWSTFNESVVAVTYGYIRGTFPPFEKSVQKGLLAIHNCLIAHFKAVKLYKSMNLGGKIGAVNPFAPATPARICREDMDACARSMEYTFDFWTEPMLKGHYPKMLLETCPELADAMPEGYEKDIADNFVRMDFLGINYYFSRRGQYDPNAFLQCKTAVEVYFAEPGQSYAPYPAGLFDLVQYVSDRYDNIDIYITENGFASKNLNDMEKECEDEDRIMYIREHLRILARLIRAGYQNLKGYYYWNDADSYEELDGYNLRFGLTWVDHKTGERRWKKSRYYYAEVCKNKMVN